MDNIWIISFLCVKFVCLTSVTLIFTDMLGSLGCFENLCHFSTQSYLDLEAGDTKSVKFKCRNRESNPGPLAPQAKS